LTRKVIGWEDSPLGRKKGSGTLEGKFMHEGGSSFLFEPNDAISQLCRRKGKKKTLAISEDKY